MDEVALPSLSRSKVLSINWSGTTVPVKNYRYFFGFDAEIKEGILTGLQPVIYATSNNYKFGSFSTATNNSNTLAAYKYGYITLVNKEGQEVVSRLPINSLFQSGAHGDLPNASLTIREFFTNVDPARSYIFFNYDDSSVLPNPYPLGISFIFYYKKRIK
jgi:hypothetical protein